MDIKKTIYSGQYKTIIKNLKEARIKQGLTQLEIAKHFSVGQSHLLTARWVDFDKSSQTGVRGRTACSVRILSWARWPP